MHDALQHFHPLVARWFAEQVGEPTEIQRQAWPRIAEGGHVLAVAPTGHGKTLTAFLWALDRLLTGQWPGNATRVLYVSPLRALNNDIQRNLLGPLAQLQEVFAAAGQEPPVVRVLTRSGDTLPAERQRMARRPPEILITTPESLNILLTSRGGRAMLDGLATVILDEVHAVAGTKRGVHLITAVERLVPLCGEFQRIALSATVQPAERIARWIGGFEVSDTGGKATYRRREVALVRSTAPKRYDLAVRLAGPIASERGEQESLWPHLADALKRTIKDNQSTLVFTNSKRKVEFVTRLVNDAEPVELVWSHHGALSREIRAVVETRLKAGELSGIVSTNTLELGIDIGALDEVVMLQTPPSVSSTVQRLGRAGHGVGQVSRGRLYPLYPRDILDAAVTARCVMAGELEPIEPIQGALDVLTQVMLSMCSVREWAVDELFDAVRASDPYRELPRRQFDLVLDMLAGRYATTRVRELRPLVSVDRVRGTVAARKGAQRLIYLGGGTIPDRGYFHLRRAETNAKVGELDEEFVWERSVGDTFTLGVQSWRVERITHNDVHVTPVRAAAAMAPFWRAEALARGEFLSERIATFLEDAQDRLDDPTLREELIEQCTLEPGAADALLLLLRTQRTVGGGRLPHRHHVLVERIGDPQGKGGDGQVVLHTVWGGRVNQPLVMALQIAWEQRHGAALQAVYDDDCIVLQLPAGVGADDLFALVDPVEVERLIQQRLPGTGFFGARFREAAGCAMLLPRRGFRHRTPLWMNRQRAKKLLQSVADLPDFPLVLEAWRTALTEAFEVPRLQALLDEVRRGEIQITEVTTSSPSPFASNVMWKQTNELMYGDDTPENGASGVRQDLLREVVFSSGLRPRLDPDLIERFEAKLQRVYPGYSPGNARELLDWVVERVLIPRAEWEALLAAMERDHEVVVTELLDELHDRLGRWAPPGGPELVCAVENLPRLDGALGEDGPTRLAAELLRFYGPVPLDFLRQRLGLAEAARQMLLQELVEEELVVIDPLREGATERELCDAENLERLLRIARAEARPAFVPVPLSQLPPFLAAQQGLAGERTGIEAVRGALEPLMGAVAPADLWETELLPARVTGYDPSWLDTLMMETELIWLGCGERRLTLSLETERDVLGVAPEEKVPEVPGLETGHHGFADLLSVSDLGSAELTRRLWANAWAGQVTNDAFAAVRAGIDTGFEAKEVEAPARRDRPGGRRGGRLRGGRGRFSRWRSARPFAGTWRRLEPVEPPRDALDEEELRRDRVRQLLDRHGVLFKALLARELPSLRWGALFRTLRLMELSGEVVAGEFFEGLPGLQFISHAAFRRLQQGLDPDRVYWVCAADPASPCGLGLFPDLPNRVPSNHLVFHGPELVVVSRRRGRDLTVLVEPGHPRIGDYLGFVEAQLTRPIRPVKSVAVETINGEAAVSSEYRDALQRLFHTSADPAALHLGVRFDGR
jgi:ATP-dependent helicase Lhr and Lhr-like helicase